MKWSSLISVLSLVCVAVLAVGCSTTPPAPRAPVAAAPAAEDLHFTDEITAIVTQDQYFLMNGEKYKVADVPKYLKEKEASQYITIVVYEESKMTRETLVALLQVLVDNDYLVVLGEESRYADVPVPKKS